MPIRKALGGLLSGPLATAVEAILRDLVEDVLDTRGFVRRAELDAVSDRVNQFRRELSERRAELTALRQAVEAMSADTSWTDDLLGDELPAAPASEDALGQRLDRATGALDALQGQAEALAGQLDGLTARADQAWQVARSALVTAESLATADHPAPQASPTPGAAG